MKPLCDDYVDLMVHVILCTEPKLRAAEWEEVANAMDIRNGRAAKERFRFLMARLAKQKRFNIDGAGFSTEKKTPTTRKKKRPIASTTTTTTTTKEAKAGARELSMDDGLAIAAKHQEDLTQAGMLTPEEVAGLKEEITEADLGKMFEDTDLLKKALASE